MIQRAISNFKAMPIWLRAFAVCGVILGPLSILAPSLPGERTNVETGEVISRHELWGNGLAIENIIIGLCLLFAGILIFRKVRFVRYLIPLMFLVAAVYFYLVPDNVDEFKMYGLIAWVGISSFYLFCDRGGRKYFNKVAEQDVPSDG